ncbi:MAG TPA: class I SAM-dependent methyltransferase [Gemmatimonadales bacterium]
MIHKIRVGPGSGSFGFSSGEVGAWSEDPLSARARLVWTSADFSPIARSFAEGAAAFVERLGLKPGESVLDVACGTGNLAIPAAKAGAKIVGSDIAPNLIAQARREARDAGVNVTFEVGDAESLPYASGRFDTTMTMFGAMFAYRPERAAAELLRVTRPGGRIAMANWTAEGFVGSLLRAHTAVAAPPPGVPSPLGWGAEDMVRARFNGKVSALTCTRRTLTLRFALAPAAVTELFAASYGPTVTTLKAADPAGASRLREDMTRVFKEHNEATDGTTAVVGEYLEVIAIVG